MSRSAFIVVTSVLALALVGLLGYGVFGKSSDDTLERAIANGEKPAAPNAQLKRPLLDGTGDRALADFKGKPVLVNFWASWCVPCEDEVPLLKEATTRLQRRGGLVLGATHDDTTTDSKKFERDNAVTWASLRDPGTDLSDGFGTRSLPESFLLDAEGRVVAVRRGQLTKAVLDDLLAKVGA